MNVYEPEPCYQIIPIYEQQKLTEEDVYKFLTTSDIFEVHKFLMHKDVYEPVLDLFYRQRSVLFNPNISVETFCKTMDFLLEKLDIKEVMTFISTFRIALPSTYALKFLMYGNGLFTIKDLNIRNEFSTKRHKLQGIIDYCKNPTDSFISKFIKALGDY